MNKITSFSNYNIENPLVLALIRTYIKNRKIFFYTGNSDNIRMFTSWLLDEATGYKIIPDNNPPPWYAVSYELSNLACILKCPVGELHRKILELESDNHV